MTRKQRAVQDSVRRVFRTWVALLSLVALLGCSQDAAHSQQGAGGAPGQGIYVTAEWNVNRRVTGHRVHVEQQRIACNACHDLKASSMGTVSPTRCASCHAVQATIQHAARLAEQRFGQGVHADCVNCHAFTSGGKGETPASALDGGVLEPYQPSQCARCHASAQGNIPAVTVHATVECVSCHRPHQDAKPVAAACANCHSGIATTHAAAGKTANETCRTCHAHQHAPASEALATCADCHSKQQPIVPATALFAGGHTACVNCHKPHEFAANQAVSCRSCHFTVAVLAEAKVPAHAVCSSCHEPHDARKSALSSCNKCHWEVHSDHPERAGLGGCLTCHAVHPTSSAQATVARPCSSCHQQASSDHAFHQGAACQSCHTPHQFKIALTQHATCRSCHQKELTLVAARTGHTACEGCHKGLPHQPSTGNGACATCHAAVHQDANAGHKNCVGCHEPHSGAIAAPCSNCHRKEAASAPLGHQACTNCHQPHSGASKQVACATCHAGEAKSPHGQLASGCLSCHRPHGPSGVATPPACTTCHTVASLPGLHAQPRHQVCSTCHTGHGDSPNLARNACLSCHTDRRDHFPNAPRCANCHLFQAAARAFKAP